MSSKDEVLESSGDNFWEIDSYKKVVKRTEDGFLLCNELIKMIQERAEIELKYSNKLKGWSNKWIENIDKSNEYGTNKSVLISSMNEAEFLANIHNEMKDHLLEVVNDVKKWRNETYKKQMVGYCKEAKQFEEDFRKAQKPWAKCLGKFLKYKKEYEINVKNEKLLKNVVAISTEEDKKLNDRLDKCRKENEIIIDKLESTQKDLNSYKPIYIADMIEVFEKTQEFEEKRLILFKNTLINMHKCLDVSQNDKIPLIYIQWRNSIELSDSKKDLKWWSQTFGADMKMTCPSLNDVINDNLRLQNSLEQLEKISIKSENLSVVSSPLKQSQETITKNKNNDSGTSTCHEKEKQTSYDVKLNPFIDDETNNQTLPSTSPRPETDTLIRKISYDPELNPFEAEIPELVDQNNKSSKNLVIAIFDYVAQEDDELTFKKGDVFKKLCEKDDQGWCTGCKDGKIGFYPEKYVKSVE